MSESLPVIVDIDFDKAAAMSLPELRHYICELEAQLLKHPQVEMPVEHHFSHKVYGRVLPIPEKTLIVGKIHKHHTMNVVLKGHVSVLSQDGVQHLKAGDLYVSTPGAKRVIYAHEDSAWANFFGTESTDQDEIENYFIAKTFDDVIPAELPAQQSSTQRIGE